MNAQTDLYAGTKTVLTTIPKARIGFQFRTGKRGARRPELHKIVSVKYGAIETEAPAASNTAYSLATWWTYEDFLAATGGIPLTDELLALLQTPPTALAPQIEAEYAS